MSETTWVVIAYLIGSIPFGFLVSKITKGIDVRILKNRKQSGSAILKEVGLFQGLATWVLDFLKGVVAVFVARLFHFSETGLLLSGLAAILGQNYPIFLKFYGGRGIATTLGAMLILDPRLTLIAAVPFVAITALLDGALGTLAMFLTFIVFAVYFKVPSYILTFGLLTFLIALFSRVFGGRYFLQEARDKREVFFNLLVFDRPRKKRI